MRLIAGAVDWSGGPPVASVEAMLNRPIAWRDRRGKSILHEGAAALGTLDFVEPGPAAGVTAQSGVLVAVDARFDEPLAIRATLDLVDATSDAELIAAAYRRWGTSFPRHLRGEFAVTLWDARQRCLVAARDPLGVRPLFLAQTETSLLVGSDPEQLLATGRVSAAPDDAVVVNYLRWTFTHPDRTFFRDVRRLRPGHVLVAREQGTTEVDYRILSPAQLSFSDQEECWTEYRRLFFQAVRRRLTSSTPVVIQTSGGLDSTSIARTADEILREGLLPCQGITAVGALHPGLACDEEPFIRAVADSVSFPVETWDGTRANPRELDDAPCSVPGGRYVLTGGTEGDVEIARRLRSRVVLSGTGGDQLGLSDGVTEDAIREGRWRQALSFTMGMPGSPRFKARQALTVAKALSPRWVQELHVSRTGAERSPGWLSPWAAGDERGVAPDGDEAPWITHVQRRRWASLTHPRTLLVVERAQQHSFRTGVEMRFPFLDWDLVTFVLAVPSRFLPPPWPQERLHREALAGLLPTRILQRRTKADFSSALAQRVTAQLGTIRELFGSNEWRMGQYVEKAKVRENLRLFETTTGPSFDLIWSVWACATLEAWLRTSSGYTSSSLEAF